MVELWYFARRIVKRLCFHPIRAHPVRFECWCWRKKVLERDAFWCGEGALECNGRKGAPHYEESNGSFAATSEFGRIMRAFYAALLNDMSKVSPWNGLSNWAQHLARTDQVLNYWWEGGGSGKHSRNLRIEGKALAKIAFHFFHSLSCDYSTPRISLYHPKSSLAILFERWCILLMTAILMTWCILMTTHWQPPRCNALAHCNVEVVNAILAVMRKAESSSSLCSATIMFLFFEKPIYFQLAYGYTIRCYKKLGDVPGYAADVSIFRSDSDRLLEILGDFLSSSFFFLRRVIAKLF